MNSITKNIFFIYFIYASLNIAAQSPKIVHPSTAIPYTKWEMRIIEIGPNRDFYGSTTQITFHDKNTLLYHRSINVIRGNIRHGKDASSGEITLFNLPYKYTLRNNILYYEHNNQEVALLKRIAKVQDNEETSNDTYTQEDAILDWLKQNAQNPAQPKKENNVKSKKEEIFNSELEGSYWELIDFSNTHLMTSLGKELNWKPKSNIFLSIVDNGEILISTEVSASGKWNVGDQHIATIILSYTDTGWNRVIGKDRLIKLEMKTPDGNKNLFHIMSDDGRSLYPVTIRRMGDDNPSYAYVNRTHVFSQLEKWNPEDEKDSTFL